MQVPALPDIEQIEHPFEPQETQEFLELKKYGETQLVTQKPSYSRRGDLH